MIPIRFVKDNYSLFRTFLCKLSSKLPGRCECCVVKVFSYIVISWGSTQWPPLTLIWPSIINLGWERDDFPCKQAHHSICPACRTSLIATRFWVVVICSIIKCLTVLEFSFILFELCLFITIFNCILNYVPIVTFWIFTYHNIWILLIIFCFIWNYWIIYFF